MEITNEILFLCGNRKMSLRIFSRRISILIPRPVARIHIGKDTALWQQCAPLTEKPEIEKEEFPRQSRESALHDKDAEYLEEETNDHKGEKR